MAAVPTEEPKSAVPPAAGSPAPVSGVPKTLSSRAGALRRLTVGTNVLVQIALLTFILLGINGYAYKHFHQFDFSRDRKNSLSDRTRKFLGGLTKPVKIIVFMVPNHPLQADMANLVEEYRNVQPKQVSIEQIDPFRNVSRAAEIQAKYKLAQQENVVIVDCENRPQIIQPEKMAEIDRSGEQFGQAPRVTAFTGEQAVTSALIEATEGKKNAVYHLQGHGEPELAAGRALEGVSTLLQKEHLDVQELNLLNVPEVPAGANALLLLGARYDLTEGEVKLLRDYWAKGGRLLILLNPDAKLPHLAGFLAEAGIRPDDDRVVITQDIGGVTLFSRDAYASLAGSTPVAGNLAGVVVPLPGATQSLTLESERVTPAGLRVEPLLLAVKGFWGETDYQDIQNTGATFDKDKDKGAPLAIAATVQRGTLQGTPKVQVNGARLVVAGNSKFIENDTLDEKSWAFFDGSLNWLLERETLIGIAPRQVKTFTLNLPDEQLRRFFWITILAMPGACAVLGLLVWWRRRA